MVRAAAVIALLTLGCTSGTIGDGVRDDAGDPNAGDPLAGDPSAGDPTAGDPFAAGDPNAGDPNAGDPFAGDPFAGDPFAGDPFAGDPFAGDPFAEGDPNSGDPNAGDPSAGDPYAGDPTTGDADAGDPSTGDPNAGDPSTGDPGPETLAEELCRLVNEYRIENELPAVPLSTAMMTVADYKVHDQIAYFPSAPCNLHSWSDHGGGLWTACCYTDDHAQAQCMWDKPREITADWGANTYSGNGYEIAYFGGSSPTSALNGWKSSSPHNDVILNQGIWSSHPWQAIGCGMLSGSACVWFGEQADPQPYP